MYGMIIIIWFNWQCLQSRQLIDFIKNYRGQVIKNCTSHFAETVTNHYKEQITTDYKS